MSAKMLFSQELQQMVVREICGEFRIGGMDGKVLCYSKDKAELLSLLVNKGYISKDVLESFVSTRLFFFGKEMCDLHHRTGTPLDHLGNLKVLGFYLARCNLLERVRIRLEHDETVGGCIAGAKGILEDVVHQLLNYEEPKKAAREESSSCCSCC